MKCSFKYPKNWYEIAEQVRANHNWKCANCGLQGLLPEKYDEWQQFKHLIIEVHHKDKNPMNCNSENLVPLCRKCHFETHKKLRSHERLCLHETE